MNYQERQWARGHRQFMQKHGLIQVRKAEHLALLRLAGAVRLQKSWEDQVLIPALRNLTRVQTP